MFFGGGGGGGEEVGRVLGGLKVARRKQRLDKRLENGIFSYILFFAWE